MTWLNDKIAMAKGNQKTSDQQKKRHVLPIATKDVYCNMYRAGYSFEEIQKQVAEQSKPRIFLQSLIQLVGWIKNQAKATRLQGLQGMNLRKRRRERGAGRPTSHPEVSTNLFSWFVAERAQGRKVKPTDLEQEAKRIDPTMTARWLERWRRRWRICRRSIQRRSTLSATERLTRALTFHKFHASWEKPEFVINFDEIPCALSGTMGSDRHTYEHKGAHSVLAVERGRQPSSHFWQ